MMVTSIAVSPVVIVQSIVGCLGAAFHGQSVVSRIVGV